MIGLLSRREPMIPATTATDSLVVVQQLDGNIMVPPHPLASRLILCGLVALSSSREKRRIGGPVLAKVLDP